MRVTPTDTALSNAQVEKVIPPEKRRYKTPVSVLGLKTSQILGMDSGEVRKACGPDEYPTLVPKTAHGIRVTTGALRSFSEGKGVSYHTFSLPYDRCVRLLKNIGKCMPEAKTKAFCAARVVIYKNKINMKVNTDRLLDRIMIISNVTNVLACN
jgi:hypothetical protein